MTVTSNRRREDHLPRPDEAPRRPLIGLAALVGALALLVGVPAALVLLVGNPLPTAVPSRDWLTTQVTPELVIKVLAGVVWVVWAHFCVCFLTEWRALRRGALPDRVLFGGGSQLLARQLIATILLLSGGVGVAHGLATASSDTPSPEAAYATSARAGAAGADSSPQSAGGPASEQSRGADRIREAAATKFTTVRPPLGRHHDTMWDIAERTLGDPFRYREIFTLNKDRVMPDGRRFSDADLIHPGWQIVLPGDASGPDVHAVGEHQPAPGVPAVGATIGAGADRAEVSGGAASGAESVVDAESTSTAVQPAAPAPESEDSGLASLLLGGGLVLAGIVRALTARRGPFGEPNPAEIDLALAGSVRRAEFVDAALRHLAQQRRSQDQPLPEVRFVYVNDERIVVHLADQVGPPSAPWTAAEDAASWSLRADHLPASSGAGPAPYPALVTVAESHGFDVLVDLELAPGLIALSGDPSAARDLATLIALDLTTHAWADGLRVFMVGFGEHEVDLGRGRATSVDSLDDVLEQLGDDVESGSQVLTRLGLTGVLQGRQSGAGQSCEPTVVILSGPPTTEQANRLARLTDGGRTPIAAACVGDSIGARWRFTVASDGGFEATALGLSGTARRLPVQAQRQLRQLMLAADERRVAGAGAVAETPVRQLAAEAVPAPLAASSWERARVRLQLLGPVAVQSTGSVADARRSLLTEVVSMAALHPDGLHEAVLRSSLWPRGVEAGVVRSRIAEVQAWLGEDLSGTPRLHRGDDGKLRLTADVVSDYGVLVGAVSATGPGELGRLLAALRLGTGPVFSGPGSHFAWMAFAREARRARALVSSAALRAAALASDRGQPEVANEALGLGLVMVPTAEELWRDLLRLRAVHAADSVDETLNQMYSALTGLGGTQEPETAALVTELRPDWHRAIGS